MVKRARRWIEAAGAAVTVVSLTVRLERDRETNAVEEVRLLGIPIYRRAWLKKEKRK
jgi:hypothetical protein